MTENKATVARYMDGFGKSDHAQILSCLSEDIEWDMPGAFHLVGRDAFDKEIENPAFIGRPSITISRMVEEDDVVVAEGRYAPRERAVVFSTPYFAMCLSWKTRRSSA